MLFYNFKSLDDFIRNELMYSIESETIRLSNLENLYKFKKSNLLTLTTDLISVQVDNINEDKSQIFYDIADLLKKSFEDLDLICKLINNLNQALVIITSLHDKNANDNYNEIKAELIEYNKKSDELSDKILIFENNSTDALSCTLEYFYNTNKKNNFTKNNFSNNYTNINPLLKNIETNFEDNNILLISEKEQKAYLPYKYSDVRKIFENSKNKYQTMQDVVNDLYVLSLSKFKNSSISRFRESFCLIRNKEKGSITKALELGLELMFKYELNPIIIAACKNLDELDIYLDCLDSNELYEFKCFDIKFEVLPQVSKNIKKGKI